MTNKDISAAYIGSEQVDKIYLGGDLVWSGGTGPEPEPDYLTFYITSPGDIVWSEDLYISYPVTIEYSKNGGPWTEITSSSGSSAPHIAVETNDVVKFRGENQAYSGTFQSGSTQYPYVAKFGNSTCGADLGGNIMSMIDGSHFSSSSTIVSANTFTRFFEGFTGLTDASELILPATTLTTGCYGAMFGGCTNLTTAPVLPATILTDYCYQSMFQGCTSLTTAPELSATTLAESCYESMFYGCSSLTTAPELPATTLAYGCYNNMFAGCTSITTAPALPATTLTQACYTGMFEGCTSLTEAPELPATTLAEGCYGNMFRGCTSLATAPALPVITLTQGCYESMFQDCTSLTEAPELPAATL